KRAQEAKLVDLANRLQSITIERNQCLEAFKKYKGAIARERIAALATMTFNRQKPSITIKFASYGRDYALLKDLERILTESGRTVSLDRSNNPALPQAQEYKVIFESGLTTSFGPLAGAFSEGELLGVPIGASTADRHDVHHLVIKVLPSEDR